MLSLRKIFDYSYSYLNIKSDDIILASFPKAGNTWVKFFIYNYLRFLKKWEEKLSNDFDTLDASIPELGNKSIYNKWIFKPTKRIVKTHNRNNFMLRRTPVIYIKRDPMDIMVSYYHYTKKNRNFNHQMNFRLFIRHRKFGLEACLQHFESYDNHPNILLLEYEELKKDPFANFSKIIKFIGIEYDYHLLQKAIDASSFQKTKLAQEKSSEKYNKQFKDGFLFARNGSQEQWKEYFDRDDLEYFEMLKAKYNYV